MTYRVQALLSHGLETLTLRLADRVVTISERLKEELVSRGVPAGKVDVVPNAVDDALIEMGATFDAPRMVRSFGYVGSLSPIEGLDVLVEAFRRAFDRGEDVQLLFHGTGSYEQELRRLVESACDPRIRVCGRFRRDEVDRVYRSVDCVVLPRRRSKLNETVTPLKPLEAMAFKRLVGVSDVRGLLEVIGDPGNAWVFPADDAAALAEALRRVHAGEVEVGPTSLRGHRFVREERAWSAVARAYAAVYARC